MLGLFGFTQLPLNTPAYPNTLVHQGESTVKMAAALQAGTPAPPTPVAGTLKQPERKTAHSAPGSPALCAAFHHVTAAQPIAAQLLPAPPVPLSAPHAAALLGDGRAAAMLKVKVLLVGPREVRESSTSESPAAAACPRGCM